MSSAVTAEGVDRQADQAHPLPRPRAGGPKGPELRFLSPASTGLCRQSGEVKQARDGG